MGYLQVALLLVSAVKNGIPWVRNWVAEQHRGGHMTDAERDQAYAALDADAQSGAYQRDQDTSVDQGGNKIV